MRIFRVPTTHSCILYAKGYTQMFVFLPQIMLLNLNNKIGMFQILTF